MIFQHDLVATRRQVVEIGAISRDDSNVATAVFEKLKIINKQICKFPDPDLQND
jgi:hypothetical protein